MKMTGLDYNAKKGPRRRRRQVVASPQAPGALVLVEATYDEGATVTLRFDRAINIDGLDAGQIIVDDGAQMGTKYQGTGSSYRPGPASVTIDLMPLGPATGAELLLSASATTGIVASDDGGVWGGVTELELPYP